MFKKLQTLKMLKKINNRFSKFLILTTALAVIVSCSKTTEPKVSYFVVKVDSIAVPDSISHSDALKIKLYSAYRQILL
ncbi:hypothetical protein HY768_10395 [candidate division TA06 bacterium]|uniref:Uncharacterized protein n=1 Tax=candidate division TA06 bacterium TaxID=2250710 RepID=A0A933IB89_UNCT6|nr:hypothetical protein [candidate division TA06 bacterium]